MPYGTRRRAKKKGAGRLMDDIQKGLKKEGVSTSRKGNVVTWETKKKKKKKSR